MAWGEKHLKRLGIMGGTFNPIHNGHLYLAREAREQYNLEHVLFMPSGTPYMKDQREVLPSEFRVMMTKLAIQDEPYFFLSTMEIEKEGNTYTYETLEVLKDMYPETDLFFILGADSLFAMEDWRLPERIFASCKILAAIRDDVSIDEIKKQAHHLEQKFGAGIFILKTNIIDISSSVIRKQLREGTSVKGLIPDAVYDYIIEHNLYSSRCL